MRLRILYAVVGILLALSFGAVLLLFQGYDPLATYESLFRYSLLGYYPFATTLRNAVPLVLPGLSAAIAFASGVINLGQPGQLVMGALFTTIGGLYLNLPPALMIPVLALLAIIGGVLWAGIAALLRRSFGMSEFIVTLMLNMIADFFTAWAITEPFKDPEAFSPMTPQIHPSGWLPKWGEFNSMILFMLLAVVFSWFIFNRFRVGYEWRITGQNALFARLGGCDINRNFISVMLLTGALAGLAGGLIVMGGPHRFIRGLGANYAWDGVMIAIVANNGIVATLLYGLFFSAIQTGALGMELITSVPNEISQVLQAVLLLVIVASREYLDTLFEQLNARRRAREVRTSTVPNFR